MYANPLKQLPSQTKTLVVSPNNTMESTGQQHQGTGRDTEPSPDLSIHRLPDEVLLEIFDFYRQSTNPYDYHWKKKHAWLNLAHVCARWRAVIFTSSSRLDLSITVGPQKPGHIKAVLSSPLPISIEYNDFTGGLVGSPIWRMRTALKHRDRVREISFGWPRFNNRPQVPEQVVFFFEKFITATNFHFPALESLTLRFIHGHKPEFPATFLRGPDQSDLRLRRLRLHDAPLASLSGLLLSATALTDLTLKNLFPNAMAFDPSRSLLLKCLQGMQCLRSLDITTPYHPRVSQPHHSTPTPKDIVRLSKLTRFHYAGPTTLWNNLMSGLSAPSLQDAHFTLATGLPVLYLSRVIDDLRDELRSVKVTLDSREFCLYSSESIYSAEIDCFRPSFGFTADGFLNSIESIINTPSTKFALAEELTLYSFISNITVLEYYRSLREFLRQFRNLRVLRVDPYVPEIGLDLHEDGTLPLLEEIELSISRPMRDSDEEYERRVAEALAVYEPFVSARERAGSVVKVYHRETAE